MNNLPFTIADVMSMCGVPRTNRLKGTVCPFCGSRTSMYYDLRESVFHCFKCDQKGGSIDFYRIYMGKPDNKAAYSEIMRSLFGEEVPEKKQKEEIEKRRKQIEKMQPKESPLRPLKERSEVYSAMLDLSALSRDHFESLLSRGLSESEIVRNGYKTLPVEKKGICQRLGAKGLTLSGVPGFYVSDGVWKLGGAKPGFLIPIRSHDYCIQGFQIRKDASAMEDGEGKYYWLSSKGYLNGTGVPGAVHYACDFHDGKPAFSGSEVFLTEGALKGDIAHFLSGKSFLCVPGVNCLNQLKPELMWLKDNGIRTVNVCFDMDYKTNPNVQKALDQTYALIYKAGLQPVSIEWDVRCKGIDDYLLSKRKKMRKTA